jgi:glutathione synthase/RimK-type ligase-like ATP-grasp enzyme
MPTVVKNHNFTFPFVLKSITGSNGEENFLVKDAAAFTDALAKIGDKKYLLQEFVPNDSDYRVIVFRDDIACAYRRVRSDDQDYLNNVKTGARRELVRADADLTHIAVTAAKSLRRELVGIDIIKNTETGEYAILEANLNFGMTDLPDGVPEAYYKSIAKLLNQYAAQL